MNFILIIDGIALLKKIAPYAMPFKDKLLSQNAKSNNAAAAFMMFLDVLQEEYPQAVLTVIWESQDSFSSRTKIEPSYRANFNLNELSAQISACQNLLNSKKIQSCNASEGEFTDYCNYIIKHYASSIPIRILSSNRNILQFLSFNTNLWLLFDSYNKALKARRLTTKQKKHPPLCCVIDAVKCFKMFHFYPNGYSLFSSLSGNAQTNLSTPLHLSSPTILALTNYYTSIPNLITDLKGEQMQTVSKWSNFLKINQQEAEAGFSEASQNIAYFQQMFLLYSPSNIISKVSIEL